MACNPDIDTTTNGIVSEWGWFALVQALVGQDTMANIPLSIIDGIPFNYRRRWDAILTLTLLLLVLSWMRILRLSARPSRPRHNGYSITEHPRQPLFFSGNHGISYNTHTTANGIVSEWGCFALVQGLPGHDTTATPSLSIQDNHFCLGNHDIHPTRTLPSMV